MNQAAPDHNKLRIEAEEHLIRVSAVIAGARTETPYSYAPLEALSASFALYITLLHWPTKDFWFIVGGPLFFAALSIAVSEFLSLRASARSESVINTGHIIISDAEKFCGVAMILVDKTAPGTSSLASTAERVETLRILIALARAELEQFAKKRKTASIGATQSRG